MSAFLHFFMSDRSEKFCANEDEQNVQKQLVLLVMTRVKV